LSLLKDSILRNAARPLPSSRRAPAAMAVHHGSIKFDLKEG